MKARNRRELRPKETTTSVPPAKQASKAVAIVRREEILQRLEAGEFGSQIASDFGITKQALSQQLVDDPAYKAARKAGWDTRLDTHEKQIQEASDPLDLARGREAFRAASWRAEREFPERWGQKGASITINTTNVDQAVIVSASDLLETVAQKRHAAVLPAGTLDPGSGEDSSGSSD